MEIRTKFLYDRPDDTASLYITEKPGEDPSAPERRRRLPLSLIKEGQAGQVNDLIIGKEVPDDW